MSWPTKGEREVKRAGLPVGSVPAGVVARKLKPEGVVSKRKGEVLAALLRKKG